MVVWEKLEVTEGLEERAASQQQTPMLLSTFATMATTPVLEGRAC